MDNSKQKQASDLAQRYFLPEGYIENPVRTTMDCESGGIYWHAQRLNDAYNYQYHVYKYALKQIRARNISTLIDVGCGPALKLDMLHSRYPSLDIVGIDQEHPIAFCKERYSFGRWLIDDFENPRTDIEDLKAGLVINADVIEHVLDPDKVLAYLQRRMLPNGLAIISTPDRERNYGSQKMESGHPDHIREWSAEEFSAYLNSRGWTILEHFYVPGMRAGFNHAYLRSFAYHLLKGKPKHMNYNQVVLAKAPRND